LGPEGSRPGRPTQAIGHAFSENLGIVQIFKEYFKFLNRLYDITWFGADYKKYSL
jgi:hypothetical protein